MPVRLRITLLFVLLASIILFIVCSSIYYFSYQARIENIKTRLTNRALTTGRLLGQSEVFDDTLVKKIDSSTIVALQEKIIIAMNEQNRVVYFYGSEKGDTLIIPPAVIKSARKTGSAFFEDDQKEAVAYNYPMGRSHVLIVAAGIDDDGRTQLSNLLRILIVTFLVGIIFVFYSGYLFSKRLLDPVRKITADVAEISAQNLARRIDTGKTEDEWYHLANTLNQLLNRLQESFELQRRFISNASHELSTPLTSISSQLEVSLQRPREGAVYRQVIESIYQDVQHMSKLTQTLLEFAKASGSPGGLEINLLRMDEILLNIPAEMAKIDPQYSVKLEFENLPEDEEQLLVFGNEPLLFTAVKNIVLNACKYSEDHRAQVILQFGEQQLIIQIRDSGPGIPPEEASKIFQPFYRVEESRQGGFGLGLSLADRIIKIHKGVINIDSQPGNGTTFTITLPGARTLAKISP